jgi:plastocyanin
MSRFQDRVRTTAPFVAPFKENPDDPIVIAMDSLRVCAGVALSLGVLCSSERPNVIAREAATGWLTGRVHVAAHPARRLATAGAYPDRIVGIQGERETSELDNVVVFVSSAMRADSTPPRVSIRQTNEEFIPHVVAVTTGSTVEFPNDDLIFHNVFSPSRAFRRRVKCGPDIVVRGFDSRLSRESSNDRQARSRCDSALECASRRQSDRRLDRVGEALVVG